MAEISGTLNIADYILLFAANNAQHDEILEKVFQRLEERGVTLNLNKCLFCKETFDFYGYTFTKDDMKPSENKISAIKNAPRPENQKAIRSFLGLCNYLKMFIADFSTKTHVLRQLKKHDAEWNWTDECENAFCNLKNELSSESCIAYFNEKHETILYTDASPYGVSAILLKKYIESSLLFVTCSN